MSHLQWRKLDILDRIERGELTLAEGAKLVGLSRRQMQRLRQKVRGDGPKALVHGNTGRAPAHRTADVDTAAHRRARAREVCRVQRRALHREALLGGGTRSGSSDRAPDPAGGGASHPRGNGERQSTAGVGTAFLKPDR